MSISVITPTNRQSNINNIIKNFLRQNYVNKELIILLNYDNPDVLLWKRAIHDYNNINLYNLGAKISLGNCLNFGITKAKFNYIAKFDDDDYYGDSYLENSLESLLKQKSDIVGKTSIYIYFKDENILGLRYSSREKNYVDRVVGSTLFFNKNIFNIVTFKDKNLGEDLEFCKEARLKGFKIYSTDSKDYIYFRNNMNIHTWKIGNEYLMKECINIQKTPDLNVFVKRWQV